MHASFELILLTKEGEILNVMPRIREEVLIRLTKLTGYQLAGYPGTKWEVLNWPDYVGHMKQISRAFNDIVFLLNREGEMPGDLRKEYFYRGTHYLDVARIEFNELYDSVSELVMAHKKQSSISELVNEYEKESKLRANLLSASETQELKKAVSGF